MKFIYIHCLQLCLVTLTCGLGITNDSGNVTVVSHIFAPREKIIFIFGDYFNLRLEGQLDIATFNVQKGQVYTNNKRAAVSSPWCDSKIHKYPTVSWQSGKNIASFWYENDNLSFKLNNFNGTHKNGCGGDGSTPRITSFYISNPGKILDNMKYVIACYYK